MAETFSTKCTPTLKRQFPAIQQILHLWCGRCAVPFFRSAHWKGTVLAQAQEFSWPFSQSCRYGSLIKWLTFLAAQPQKLFPQLSKIELKCDLLVNIDVSFRFCTLSPWQQGCCECTGCTRGNPLNYHRIVEEQSSKDFDCDVWENRNQSKRRMYLLWNKFEL